MIFNTFQIISLLKVISIPSDKSDSLFSTFPRGGSDHLSFIARGGTTFVVCPGQSLFRPDEAIIDYFVIDGGASVTLLPQLLFGSGPI